MIACIYDDGQIVIWSCLTNSIVHQWRRNELLVVFFEFIESNFIVVFEDGHLQSYNPASGESKSASVNSSIIGGCSFKNKLLLLTDDSSLIVFDVKLMTSPFHFKESDLGSQEHNGFVTVASRSCGDEIVLTGKNRTLRILSVDFDEGKVLLKFKLQDAVDKYNWKCAGFSYHSSFDASFTFAAAATKGRHLIYIWENSTSNLVHKIEGPKEELSQVLWSPIKPQLYSVGALSGKIYNLGPQFPQKWAALVPNIEALETNIEYIEREDEFDLSPEDEITKNREHDESIELDLDSFTTPTISASKCSTILFPL